MQKTQNLDGARIRYEKAASGSEGKPISKLRRDCMEERIRLRRGLIGRRADRIIRRQRGIYSLKKQKPITRGKREIASQQTMPQFRAASSNLWRTRDAPIILKDVPYILPVSRDAYEVIKASTRQIHCRVWTRHGKFDKIYPGDIKNSRGGWETELGVFLWFVVTSSLRGVSILTPRKEG
jgi:hypothetical protein